MRRWLVAAAALGFIAFAWTASGSLAASAGRSCPAYKITFKKSIYGHTWRFHDKISLIRARGIGCAGSRKLIRRVEVYEPAPMPLFTWVPVGRWKCEIPLRPYGGPHWKTGLVCKRPGRHLVFTDTLLHSKRLG